MKSRRKLTMIAVCLVIVLMIAIGAFVLNSPKVVESVTIEAGEEMADITSFLMNKKAEGTFDDGVAALPINVPGVYEVDIKVGRKIHKSQLIVVDTIAPVATTINHTIWNDESKVANDFVSDIIDATEVDVSFKQMPDFTKTGEHQVIIVLQDTSDNRTELTALLTVISDTEAPVIHGAENQTIYLGSTISYRKGVTVTDNKDEEVELVVDSDAVSIKKEGTYPVIYTATDAAGNLAEVKVTITVKEKKIEDPDVIYKLADEVLAKIIKGGMTEREKARAIFNWVNRHITYINYSNKSNWLSAAYRGIKSGSGDCYVFYATSRALLTRAGFSNRTVIRTDGTHFWNLVNWNGDWYHFDASPRASGHTFDCFLRTDAEVEEYSKGYRNYYNFDKTKHPPTPE